MMVAIWYYEYVEAPSNFIVEEPCNYDRKQNI